MANENKTARNAGRRPVVAAPSTNQTSNTVVDDRGALKGRILGVELTDQGNSSITETLSLRDLTALGSKVSMKVRVNKNGTLFLREIAKVGDNTFANSIHFSSKVKEQLMSKFGIGDDDDQATVQQKLGNAQLSPEDIAFYVIEGEDDSVYLLAGKPSEVDTEGEVINLW